MIEKPHRAAAPACKKIVNPVPDSSATSHPSSSLDVRPPRPAQEGKERGTKGKDMLRVAESTGHSASAMPVGQRLPHRRTTTTPERILVVEDDRAVQKALQRLF